MMQGRALIAVVACSGLLTIGTSGRASPLDTSRVTVAADGAQANGESVVGPHGVSDDGRYIAFSSSGTNLVAGDTNGRYDVFVKDRTTGAVERVTTGNGDSFVQTISGNGRWVLYYSFANNLVPNDTNGEPDEFIHDRQLHTSRRISEDPNGEQGDGSSGFGARITPDGTQVLFATQATFGVANSGNQTRVYVKNLVTGGLERIDQSTTGQLGDCNAEGGDISDDGRFVIFTSCARNLDPSATYLPNYSSSNAFIRDRIAATTSLLVRNLSGDQPYPPTSGGGIFSAGWSANTRLVTFWSYATDLSAEPTNGLPQVFLLDRSNGVITIISKLADGTPGDGPPAFPYISRGGRHVAFLTNASNLTEGVVLPGDQGVVGGGVVKDLQTASLQNVCVTADGRVPNGMCGALSLNADGTLAAFWSTASNLVPGDTNGVRDGFVVILPPSDTPPNPLLSDLKDAKAWVGLKNSDDVGLRLDLQAEVSLNSDSNKIGTGHLDSVPSGSSGFNNAQLRSIPLDLINGPVLLPIGSQLKLTISARRTCFGPGHATGTARLWYNGKPIDSGAARDAGTRFTATIEAEEVTFNLRSGLSLDESPGASRLPIDLALNSKEPCPQRQFIPFGTWSWTVTAGPNVDLLRSSLPSGLLT